MTPSSPTLHLWPPPQTGHGRAHETGRRLV
jgi:hypothetical protein